MRYVDLGKLQKKKKVRSRRKRWPFFCAGVFLLSGAALFISGIGFSDLLPPLVAFSRVVNPKKVTVTDGRTNFLLLAVDKRELEKDSACEDSTAGSALLTDTMLMVSVPKDGSEGKKTVLISLPRDLWVSTVNWTGKLNSAYVVGSRSDGQGARFASRVVEGILGIPIHYFAVVDFSGFKRAIDVLDGITVDVERTFDDYRYPIPGKECAEPEEERWEHIHFDAGQQKMDGARALKFVRSRKSLGPEGSDFARSSRQQKVILAVRDKVLQLSILSDLGKISKLYKTFSQSVEMNISLSEVRKLFDLSNSIEGLELEVLGQADGFFYTPEDLDPYEEAWVLLPQGGNFSEVRAYVNSLLFDPLKEKD